MAQLPLLYIGFLDSAILKNYDSAFLNPYFSASIGLCGKYSFSVIWINWHIYVFVHIVFKEVWTCTASMSIKNSKVTAFWPSSFIVWFCYVHNDWYSILIIIFDQSMKSINSIPFDKAISFLNEVDIINFWYFVVFLRLLNWFHFLSLTSIFK